MVMAGKVVRIVGSSLVAPAADTPRDSIWMSNLDLGSGRRSYTPTVYLYEPSIHDDPESFFSLERLRAGLARVLVRFYPFAGTLGFDDQGRVELKCTAEGVRLVEATCDSTVDEFGDFAPSQDLRKRLVPFQASADPPCPVIMFQVTRFKCGGVTLGVAGHHMMGDGSAILYFINSWAAVTRGVDPSSITPPFLDRRLLRARSPPRVEYDHSEHASSYDGPSQPTSPPPAGATAILRISKEQLTRLKGTDNDVTTFTAVVSHAWRCACKARRLSADETTRLFIAADIRDRLQPPLPPEFLGNAILFMPIESEVGDLMSGGVGHVTAKLQVSKSNLHDGYLRSLIDFLEQQEGPMKGPWALPPNDLYAVSWLRLPIYEADFGWGRPVFMGRAGLPYRGRLYFTRSSNGDGAVYLTVALEEEFMADFQKYFYQELHEAVQENDVAFKCI